VCVCIVCTLHPVVSRLWLPRPDLTQPSPRLFSSTRHTLWLGSPLCVDLSGILGFLASRLSRSRLVWPLPFLGARLRLFPSYRLLLLPTKSISTICKMPPGPRPAGASRTNRSSADAMTRPASSAGDASGVSWFFQAPHEAACADIDLFQLAPSNYADACGRPPFSLSMRHLYQTPLRTFYYRVWPHLLLFR
jgi:hypothetical protein